MRIGIPKEIHAGEMRVATTPDVAAQLQKLGFTVSVEAGGKVEEITVEKGLRVDGKIEGVVHLHDMWGVELI